MTARSKVRAHLGLKPIRRPYRTDMILARRRRLTIEALEHRTLLTGTPSVTLELIPGVGSSLPAVTLTLDSYQFGFVNATTIGSATSGAGAGKATFNELTVTDPLSGASPQLFAALVAGGHYQTAVLTQRNGAGDPVAEWV